jgi:hypothetical protein
MKKIIIMALVALFAINAAACGSDPVAKAKAAPKAKVWTTAKVEREYDTQLQDALSEDGESTTVETHCLLKEGKEGEFGTLKCHLDYDDGDTSTIEIDVDKTGDWIANTV